MGYNACACGGKKASPAPRCLGCTKRLRFRGKCDITEAEVAWVAGILEGEGCWTANHSAWHITVRMTDSDIISRLQLVTGVGTLHVAERALSGRKQAYGWVVSAEYDREWLTRLVYPWMGIRRRAKIGKFMPSLDNR